MDEITLTGLKARVARAHMLMEHGNFSHYFSLEEVEFLINLIEGGKENG